MHFKITLLSILFFFTIVCSSFSQNIKSIIRDHSYSVHEVNAYWQNMGGHKNSPGYKSYQRWKYRNQFKYGASGVRDLDLAPVFNNYTLIKNTLTQDSQHYWIERSPLQSHQLVEGAETGDGGMGRIDFFYVNPSNENHIYIATRGGSFWRTTNGGQNWEGSTTDSLFTGFIVQMAVAPSNPQRVYIKVQNAYTNGIYIKHGILLSNDGGQTWNTTNLIDFFEQQAAYSFLTIDPQNPDIVYFNDGFNTYKTTDAFNSFNLFEPLNNHSVYDLKFAPANNQRLYASTANQLYRSDNDGVSFDAISTIPNTIFNIRRIIEIPPSRPQEVFIRGDEEIFKSDNYGEDLSLLYNNDGFIWGFAPSNQANNIMLLGRVNLYRSTDSGQTFDITNAAQKIHVDIRNIQYISGAFYTATDGFLAKSTDEGLSWTILNPVMNIRENYAINPSQQDATMYIAGAQDNGTELQQTNQLRKISGSDGMMGIIHPLNRNMIVSAAQQGSRYLSFDGAKNQISLNQFGANGVWNSPLIFSKGNFLEQYIFLGGKIFKSEAFGLDENLIFNNEAYDIYQADYAFNHPNIFAFAASSAPFSPDSTFVFISEDAGQSFRKSHHNLPLSGAASALAFSPNNDSLLIVTYGAFNSDKTILMSTDLGHNWINITFNLENIPVNAVAIDHAQDPSIYVGTALGVFTKKLSDNIWSLYANGLPIVEIRDLNIQFGSNQLYAATYGRGTWSTQLKGSQHHPSIQQVELSIPPSLNAPKLGQEVKLSAQIESEYDIASAFILYGVNTTELSEQIELTASAEGFIASNIFPSDHEGDLIYFKVIVEDVQGHRSESFRYMYRIKALDYCEQYVLGNNLGPFNYIKDFSLSDLHISKNQGLGFTNISDQYELSLTEGETYTANCVTSSILDGTQAEVLLAFDWNGDFEFDIETESYYLGNNPPLANAPTSLSPFTLNVPSNIALDTVRMRLFLLQQSDASYELLTNDLCHTALYAEILDLDVKIEHLPNANQSIFKNNELLVYPNPSGDYLQLASLPANQSFDIQIIGLDGKLHWSRYNVNSAELSINVSQLKAGAYILKIASSNGNWHAQFVK